MIFPHFSTLQKITDLESKISLLEADLLEINSKLTHTKNFYKNAEKKEYNRLLEIHIQENILESIKNEITLLRTEENLLRTDVHTSIQSSIDSFISQNGYNKLIQKIWEEEIVKNPDLRIDVTNDMQEYGSKYPSKVIEGNGLLRIVSDKKTYILDKKILVEKLTQKLFIQVLSS